MMTHRLALLIIALPLSGVLGLAGTSGLHAYVQSLSGCLALKSPAGAHAGLQLLCALQHVCVCSISISFHRFESFVVQLGPHLSHAIIDEEDGGAHRSRAHLFAALPFSPC